MDVVVPVRVHMAALQGSRCLLSINNKRSKSWKRFYFITIYRWSKNKYKRCILKTEYMSNCLFTSCFETKWSSGVTYRVVSLRLVVCSTSLWYSSSLSRTLLYICKQTSCDLRSFTCSIELHFPQSKRGSQCVAERLKTHCAVGLSFIQNLKQLIDGCVR